MNASEENLKIANDFLEKFIIQSESSVNGSIDLQLVLKALPDKIKPYLINRVQLFSFRIFQESLLAHKNKGKVDAFEYFDKRNKDRVYAIKDTLLAQKKELTKVKESLASVQNKLINSDDQNMNNTHGRAASAFTKRSKARKQLNFEEVPLTELKKKAQSSNYGRISQHKSKSQNSENDSEDESKHTFSKQANF